MNPLSLAQGSTASLIIGSNLASLKKICVQKLKNSLCRENKKLDCPCSVCQEIESGHGQSFLWLTPNGWYDVKAADTILNKTSLKLPLGSSFTIIVDLVERMPKTCANRILKTVEEPPTGYKFIFTTKNSSQVLPTIKSRCQIFALPEQGPEECSDKIGQAIIAEPGQKQMQEFFELVDELAPDQVQSQETLEFLLAHAAQEQKKLLKTKNPNKSKLEQANRLIQTCTTFSKIPPQPGSGKIFWKNFFVQLVL